MLVTLTLPWPPPLSALFNNVPRIGRVPTKRYNKWKGLASRAIHNQAPTVLMGAVSLEVRLCPPDRRRRDLSNHIKALEDALVADKVIEDDSLIQRLVIEWASNLQVGAYLELKPYRVAGPLFAASEAA